MKPERWKQVDELLEAALECPAAERPSFLDRACAGDEELRRELESLLISDAQAKAFIETQPRKVAADLFVDEEPKRRRGERIAHYEILEQIGSGGMGEVYLATDTRLGRKVALKFLPSSLTADPQLRARFLREAQLASALDHPNVCTIHEVGESSGHLFIAMQYVEGVTLKKLIGSRPLKLDALISITYQAASALVAAHELGIIHRDIKPGNIIVTPKGQAKVLDFGLAKVTGNRSRTELSPAEAELTRTGVVMGTPNYMSPEQARGERVDHRTDMFSLGAVIYEMATGKMPFSRKSQAETMNAVINERHTPVAQLNSEIPEQLSAAIDRALSKDPADRYQSMGEMLLALREVGGRPPGLMGASDAQATSIRYVPLGRPSPRRWLWAMSLLGLMLLVGLGLWFSSRRTWTTQSPAHIQALAVLPMENLSGDPTQEYFADGMTDALITDLSKISALQVISRAGVMPYKGSNKSVAEISRELKVDAVVSGSVLRAGERVRISVHLIPAATNRNLWVESYERDLRDVLALQRDVAGDIAGEIRIKLSPQEQAQIESSRPVNPKAYDQYLRGRFYANRKNKDDNETAIVSLERAVDLDPTFASAYAELAQAYRWKRNLFDPLERQWEEKAFVATEKALSLDPNLGVAHLARGLLLWTPANHFPHEKAIREYRRALDLNPNLDEARSQLAVIYCHIGAFDEALREAQKAIVTNPNNDQAQLLTGETLNFQGRYEQGLTVLRSIRGESNPVMVGHHIAWALFNLGRKEEASATLEQLVRDHPEDSGGIFTSLQAVLAASAGQERIAEDQIKRAEKKEKGFGHFHHTAYNIACAYALMNKPEQAIRWLETAAEEGFPCYQLFESDSNLNNLRHDPVFVTFLTKMRKQWENYKIIL
jgi:serine/threonine protein kinase/Flp pilus assembly protein TadD